MRRTRRARIGLIGAAIVGLAATASAAPPSIWERARRSADGEDPVATEKAYREALRFETTALLIGGLRDDGLGDDLRRRALLSLLPVSRARTRDVRVLRLAGSISASLRSCDGAEVDLRRAIELAPDDPDNASAWFELAICASRRHERQTEALDYERALAICDDPHERAVLESNLAEARMALGEIPAALAAIERALLLRDDAPLAWWNLAIVQDRADDPAQALSAAVQALSLDPELAHLEGPAVFFDPPYEPRWYHALALLAKAERDKGDPALRRADLLIARAAYATWLVEAEPDDRWRAIAIRRVAWLDKLVAAMPPPAASGSAKPAK